MSKNRIKLYWLLLMSLMFTTIIVSGVGVSRARYNDTITAPAVMSAPVKNITSNCLAARKDADRTVLLGEMPMEQWIAVPFWLLSSEEDATITLDWGVTDEIHKEYLQVAVLSGSDMVKANKEIELFQDLKQEFILYLAPTELARSMPRSAMDILVHVTMDEEMWGTFKVTLPEVEMLPTEQPVDETEEVSEEAAVLEVTETLEGTETEEVTEGTDNTESTENGETEEERGSPESQENQEESEDPYKERDELITMKAINAIHTTQQLPVVMTLAEHITSVRFGVQEVVAEENENKETNQEETQTEMQTEVSETEESEASTVIKSLPDYTMFSVDGGQSYYMTYGGYIPELVLHEVTKVPILIDFSYANWDMEADLLVVMEAYMDDQLRKTVTAETDRTEKESTEEVLGPVLDFDRSIEFTFPVEVKDTKIEYSVKYLMMDEENKLNYVPYELSEDGLQGIYDKKDDTHRLKFKLGKKFSDPGTYKLIVTRSYEGLCYEKIEKIFFVNCSGREEALMSSSEVSND